MNGIRLVRSSLRCKLLEAALPAALCAPAMALAQAGPCQHLGQQVTCPNHPATGLPLPPGSSSLEFLLNATRWQILGGGTVVIPLIFFSPFVPMPPPPPGGGPIGGPPTVVPPPPPPIAGPPLPPMGQVIINDLRPRTPLFPTNVIDQLRLSAAADAHKIENGPLASLGLDVHYFPPAQPFLHSGLGQPVVPFFNDPDFIAGLDTGLPPERSGSEIINAGAWGAESQVSLLHSLQETLVPDVPPEVSGIPSILDDFLNTPKPGSGLDARAVFVPVLPEAYAPEPGTGAPPADVTFWAGHRFYRRKDVHIDDFFHFSTDVDLGRKYEGMQSAGALDAGPGSSGPIELVLARTVATPFTAVEEDLQRETGGRDLKRTPATTFTAVETDLNDGSSTTAASPPPAPASAPSSTGKDPGARLREEAAADIYRRLTSSSPDEQKQGRERLEFASPEVRALVGQKFALQAIADATAAADAANAPPWDAAAQWEALGEKSKR